MKKGKEVEQKKSILKNYEDIAALTQRKISPLQFESYCSKKITLFTLDETFNFEKVEADIDRVLRVIPSMKRIFAKPLIDLIDKDNVLPVESVRKINSKTLGYAINHITTIDNILEGNQVKPRTLLTSEYILLYATYENKTFVYLAKLLMHYAKATINHLNNFLFLNDNEFNINVLERINHESYYLAIGKLHTSYIRNFSKSYDDIRRIKKKIRTIYETINSRTNTTVYKKCINTIAKGKKYELKKTNIFRNQKDYKNVYNLLRFMQINYETLFYETYDQKELEKLQPLYLTYVEALLLFALTHFNFSFGPRVYINFKKLNVSLTFDKYKVTITQKEYFKTPYLLLEFVKDINYKMVIFPNSNPNTAEDIFKQLKHNVTADDYIYVSPFHSVDNSIYISVNNIDSFRRIQQKILKGMVYSSKRMDVCPFCGDQLVRTEDKSKEEYECLKCRLVITKKICPNTNLDYYSTSIRNYRLYINSLKSDQRLRWMQSHTAESQMHYRNINPLDERMEEICPICGKKHFEV